MTDLAGGTVSKAKAPLVSRDFDLHIVSEDAGLVRVPPSMALIKGQRLQRT